MDKDFCEKCGSPTRWVNGGISRKGKPYSGFYACSSRNCDWTYNPPARPVDTESTPGTIGAGTKTNEERIIDGLLKIYKRLDDIELKVDCLLPEPKDNGEL